ncbi:hypothetical protein WJX74_006026 [Apatococcus lobatus]|uniref:Uncharacterized protein n=1 Tax=Apatococcus lobatus TaxID=904363 RepID=A0AAW1Q5R4_9CHLO
MADDKLQQASAQVVAKDREIQLLRWPSAAGGPSGEIPQWASASNDQPAAMQPLSDPVQTGTEAHGTEAHELEKPRDLLRQVEQHQGHAAHNMAAEGHDLNQLASADLLQQHAQDFETNKLHQILQDVRAEHWAALQELHGWHQQTQADLAAKDQELITLRSCAAAEIACAKREEETLRKALQDCQARGKQDACQLQRMLFEARDQQHAMCEEAQRLQSVLQDLQAKQKQAAAKTTAKDQQIARLTSDAAHQKADATCDIQRLHRVLQDDQAQHQHALAQVTTKCGQIAALKSEAAGFSNQQHAVCEEAQRLQNVLQDLQAKRKQAAAEITAKDQQIAWLTSDAAHQKADAACELQRLQRMLQDVQAQHQHALAQVTAKDDQIAALKSGAAAHQEAAVHMRKAVQEQGQQHEQALVSPAEQVQRLQAQKADMGNQQDLLAHDIQRLQRVLQDVRAQQHQAFDQATARDTMIAALNSDAAAHHAAFCNSQGFARSLDAQHKQALAHATAAQAEANQGEQMLQTCLKNPRAEQKQTLVETTAAEQKSQQLQQVPDDSDAKFQQEFTRIAIQELQILRSQQEDTETRHRHAISFIDVKDKEIKQLKREHLTFSDILQLDIDATLHDDASSQLVDARKELQQVSRDLHEKAASLQQTLAQLDNANDQVKQLQAQRSTDGASCSSCAARQGEVTKLEVEVKHTTHAKSRLRHKLRSKQAQHKEVVSDLAVARSIAAQRYDALLKRDSPALTVQRSI